jgi:hypothetical protein
MGSEISECFENRWDRPGHQKRLHGGGDIVVDLKLCLGVVLIQCEVSGPSCTLESMQRQEGRTECVMLRNNGRVG